jgi:hypothetical protein
VKEGEEGRKGDEEGEGGGEEEEEGRIRKIRRN